MAGPKDVIASQFASGTKMMGMFTRDLKGEEYFKSFIEGGNHAAWLVGHIASTEDSVISRLAGEEPTVEQATNGVFVGGQPCKASASDYPTRAAIDDLFASTRARALAVLDLFDASTWDDPSPDSLPKEIMPTMGSAWNMLALHQFWHIGQILDCRKALNKPGVFV